MNPEWTEWSKRVTEKDRAVQAVEDILTRLRNLVGEELTQRLLDVAMQTDTYEVGLLHLAPTTKLMKANDNLREAEQRLIPIFYADKYKVRVGDKVRLTSVEPADVGFNLAVGEIHEITHVSYKPLIGTKEYEEDVYINLGMINWYINNTQFDRNYLDLPY